MVDAPAGSQAASALKRRSQHSCMQPLQVEHPSSDEGSISSSRPQSFVLNGYKTASIVCSLFEIYQKAKHLLIGCVDRSGFTSEEVEDDC